ncbi:MAG: signal peptidase I [Ruminococcaceae bacterium]|nr:signal peptidase I [Oscillospiraceae bacterium]
MQDQEFNLPEGTDNEGTHGGIVSALFDVVEILAFSLLTALVIFTCFFRLCRVSGDSMNNTFIDGQLLVTHNVFYTPEQGDVIVFHMTSDKVQRYNEPMIKRVIATEGQTVRIDYGAKQVYVDGVALKEDYVYLLYDKYYLAPSYDFDYQSGIFEATVPEGHLFVMGDNRNNSADSRQSEIGFIDQRRILGKVILRFAPFTTY